MKRMVMIALIAAVLVLTDCPVKAVELVLTGDQAVSAGESVTVCIMVLAEEDTAAIQAEMSFDPNVLSLKSLFTEQRDKRVLLDYTVEGDRCRLLYLRKDGDAFADTLTFVFQPIGESEEYWFEMADCTAIDPDGKLLPLTVSEGLNIPVQEKHGSSGNDESRKSSSAAEKSHSLKEGSEPPEYRVAVLKEPENSFPFLIAAGAGAMAAAGIFAVAYRWGRKSRKNKNAKDQPPHT